MDKRFEEIYAITAKAEGGFQKDSRDSANYCDGKLIGTNRGISATFLKGIYGRCPTETEVRSVTEDQAFKYAYERFWLGSGADKIKDVGVAHLVFQEFFGGGYNGMQRVRMAINNAYGKGVVSEDKKSISNDSNAILAINTMDPRKMFENIWIVSVNHRKQNPTYAKGWLTRWNRLHDMYYGNYIEKSVAKSDPGGNNLPSGAVITAGAITIGIVGIVAIAYVILKRRK